jgi:hypothetical protein
LKSGAAPATVLEQGAAEATGREVWEGAAPVLNGMAREAERLPETVMTGKDASQPGNQPGETIVTGCGGRPGNVQSRAVSAWTPSPSVRLTET